MILYLFFSSRRRHTRLQGDGSLDVCFFFSSRRRHTRLQGDWSSDVCSSDLRAGALLAGGGGNRRGPDRSRAAARSRGRLSSCAASPPCTTRSTRPIPPTRRDRKSVV